MYYSIKHDSSFSHSDTHRIGLPCGSSQAARPQRKLEFQWINEQLRSGPNAFGQAQYHTHHAAQDCRRQLDNRLTGRIYTSKIFSRLKKK